MSIHGLQLAASFGLAAAALAAKPGRAGIASLGRAHLAGYASITLAAGLLPLLALPAISNHAFRAHEDDYFSIFTATDAPMGGALQVRPMLAELYALAGRLTDGRTAGFVGTALLLSVWGPALFGMALQLATRSAWAGLAAAALVAADPQLAYWRLHAYHVAAPQTALAATFVLAVLFALRPTALGAAAAGAMAGVAVGMRIDMLLPLVGVAGVALAIAGRSLLLRRRDLLLLAAVAASGCGFQLWSTLHSQFLAEDMRMGLRLLGLHLRVAAPWWPLSHPAFAILLALLAVLRIGRAGAAAAARGEGEPTAAPLPPAWLPAALAVAGLLSAFPGLLFTDMGARNLLPAKHFLLAALLAAFAAGPGPVAVRARRFGSPLLAWIAISGCLALFAMHAQYADGSAEIPGLPGVGRPTAPLPRELRNCGLFTSHTELCDAWERCWPLKDLRDPGEVARRWDETGCLLWAVSPRDDDVAGSNAERWAILRTMPGYRWEPAGTLDGGRGVQTEVYRLVSRPRARAVVPPAAREEEIVPDE